MAGCLLSLISSRINTDIELLALIKDILYAVNFCRNDTPCYWNYTGNFMPNNLCNTKIAVCRLCDELVGFTSFSDAFTSIKLLSFILLLWVFGVCAFWN